MFDKFSDRHIGVTNPEDLKAMLAVIGVKSVDELIAQVIPQSIRLKQPLALPQGMSEYEFANHIQALAAKNRTLRSFIGMGYYPCAVPAAITRNVFENPAWYTSYTPYQAEISQGRLEALLNFQTAMISLTGMEIGNCSLLDEGTAAAEAMAMMFSLRSRDAVREGRNQLFVDRNIFPQTLDVLLTRSEPFGIELIVDDYDEYEFTGREFGAIVQYPAADGRVRDYSDFTAAAHAKGALVTVAADLLSLALLKAPGEWGADIAVGSAQRLGTPMGFGGPAAGYMTTREAFKRNMPGRIIGVSVDRLGNKALRMALQMREQHIKRERATSNICTASALMASMTGFYCVYNGPEGLRRAAETAHLAAATVARAAEMGVAIGAHPGYPDLVGFGRRNMSVSPAEVKAMVQYQIGALMAFCQARGVRMQHVKPHGAMYNMAGKDAALARAICEGIREIDPQLILLGLSGSELIRAAQAVGLPYACEVFADRAYEDDGSLVARSKPGAMIADEEEAIRRVIGMVSEGKVTSITGKEIPVQADSVCLHGDGPRALAFARRISTALKDRGIAIVPLASGIA